MSAVNRDTKTQATLLALARTRRMQRALAHASLHHNSPMPTLRSSLGYMTSTACVAEDGVALGHRMTVLGISRFDAVVYVVEEISGDDAPIVSRLYLSGPRQGHMVPIRAWYEHSEDMREIRALIAALRPTLEPALPVASEAWMLSTRIIQRRALRLSCGDLPIRKFALQLVVEPVGMLGPCGRSTVTAFLRPQAQLTGVWSLARSEEQRSPCDVAIARITFTGIPSGTGLTKDTVVLLTSGLPGLHRPADPGDPDGVEPDLPA
jgi:hypothetical protein